MKIAHFSDIHFTTFFRNFELYKFESLLHYCNSKNIDHLIITNDLVENPNEYDFGLLKKVLKQNGFLTSDRLSLVIGNHDIFELFNNFKVDLVLYGHYHESSQYFKKGIRFLNAGGSFKNDLINQNQINFFDTSFSALKIEINKIPQLLNPKIFQFNSLNSVKF